MARDIAHAKLKERLDAGEGLPQYLKDHAVYYAGPGEDPEGHGVGHLRAHDGGPHGLVRRSLSVARREHGDARQGQPLGGGHRACKKHGGFYLGSIGGPAARLAQDCIKKVEVLEYPELGMEAVWKIEVVDFPAFIVVDDKGNGGGVAKVAPMRLTVAAGALLPAFAATSSSAASRSATARTRGIASAAREPTRWSVERSGPRSIASLDERRRQRAGAAQLAEDDRAGASLGGAELDQEVVRRERRAEAREPRGELRVGRQVRVRRRPRDPRQIREAVAAGQGLRVALRGEHADGVLHARDRHQGAARVGARQRLDPQREIGVAAGEIDVVDGRHHLESPTSGSAWRSAAAIGATKSKATPGGAVTRTTPRGRTSAAAAVRTTSLAHSAMRRAGSSTRSPSAVQGRALHAAHEQRLTDAGLERGQATADGGLGDRQDRRRLAEAAVLGDRDQQLDVAPGDMHQRMIPCGDRQLSCVGEGPRVGP